MPDWLRTRLGGILENVVGNLLTIVVITVLGGGVVAAVAIWEDAPIAVVVLVFLWAAAGVEWALIGMGKVVVRIPTSPAQPPSLPTAPPQPRVPDFNDPQSYQVLVEENVRWEDRGDNRNGAMIIVGPLCPKHLTPLTVVDYHSGERRPAGDSDTIDPHSTYVPQTHTLICPDDESEEFVFSRERKIESVRNEVRTRFVGIRNRIRQGMLD